MDSLALNYSIWIEAEERALGEWNPCDDNSDVIITFNGSDQEGMIDNKRGKAKQK
jgi:hypothetical protein